MSYQFKENQRVILRTLNKFDKEVGLKENQRGTVKSDGNAVVGVLWDNFNHKDRPLFNEVRFHPGKNLQHTFNPMPDHPEKD